MRQAALLILLIAGSFQSFAQKADTLKESKSIDSILKHGALLVVDGEVVTKRPPKLQPDSILFVNILLHDKVREIFENDAQNGVVVIVNRRAAIKAYQNKLSKFSNDYKQHISLRSNDEGVFYIVNDRADVLMAEGDERIKKLYEIPEDKIEKVEMHEQQSCCGINWWCYITVKQ